MASGGKMANDGTHYAEAYRALRVELIHVLSTTSELGISPEIRWRLSEALKRAERVRAGAETFGGQKQGS